MIDSYEAGKINEALKTFAQSTNNQSISMPAEVLGTDEDGTTWVQVIGGNEKTPLATSTVSLSEGDMVNVTIGNGRAEARGNLTDPSASSTSLGRVEATANEAYQGVGMAFQASEAAQQAAAEAQEVAEAVNQHFWHRDTQPTGGAGTGAFVTDETQEYFLAHTEGGETPEAGHPLHNLLMNAEGILLRAAKKIRAAFTPSGVAFYDGTWDGQGDGSSHIVAQFGASLARIGKASGNHVDITTDKVEFSTGNNGYASIGYDSNRQRGSLMFDDSEFFGSGSLAGIDARSILFTSVGTVNSETVSIGDNYFSILFATGGIETKNLSYSNNGVLFIGTLDSNEPSVSITGSSVNATNGGDASVRLSAATTSSNHGLWSTTNGKWIVHADSNDNIYLNNKKITNITANRFFASPNGDSGDAMFRAIEAKDIPSLPASKITNGTFTADRIPPLSPSKVGLNRRSETTVANVLTISSGFTASNVTCLYTNVWAQLRTAIKTNNALTSGTNYSVATIKDAYKPYMGTAGGMYSGTNADVYVDGSAVIHVVPRININADSTLYISIPMYFLA